MSTGRCCRPQSWPEARPPPGDAQPLEIFMEGKSGQKAKPALVCAGQGDQRYEASRVGPSPPIFLLIRSGSPAGLPAAPADDAPLCRLEAVPIRAGKSVWRLFHQGPGFLRI